MKRQNGYYWIRFDEGPWEVAEWWNEYGIWLTLSSSMRGSGPHMDCDRIEVGERIIKQESK